MSTGEIINPHPGEILFEEFLKPMALSQSKLAIELSVPCHRINEIIHGRRGITADTASGLRRPPNCRIFASMNAPVLLSWCNLPYTCTNCGHIAWHFQFLWRCPLENIGDHIY